VPGSVAIVASGRSTSPRTKSIAKSRTSIPNPSSPSGSSSVARSRRRRSVEARAHRRGHRVGAERGVALQRIRSCGPVPERDDDVLQLAAAVGQLVDTRARGQRELALQDDPGLLELAQALGEHAGLAFSSPLHRSCSAWAPVRAQLRHRSRTTRQLTCSTFPSVRPRLSTGTGARSLTPPKRWASPDDQQASDRDSRGRARSTASAASDSVRAVMRRVGELVGRRRRRAGRAASTLVALVTAVLAVAVPSSAATRECFLLTQCAPVVGPWVVIPAADPTPSPAGVTVSCPSSDSVQLALGSDYELSGGGGPPPDVTRYMPGPGIGLVTGGNAAFFAITCRPRPRRFARTSGASPSPEVQRRRNRPWPTRPKPA